MYIHFRFYYFRFVSQFLFSMILYLLLSLIMVGRDDSLQSINVQLDENNNLY